MKKHKEPTHLVQPTYDENHNIIKYCVACGAKPSHPKFTHENIHAVSCVDCRMIYNKHKLSDQPTHMQSLTIGKTLCGHKSQNITSDPIRVTCQICSNRLRKK